MELSAEEKGVLLLSAREAIRGLFDPAHPPVIDFKHYPQLAGVKNGVFVTLTKNKQLRGCIGFLHSDKNLIETVVDAARHAAFHDPRFPQVQFEEIKDLEIEISVLSEPFPLKDYNDIEIGKHGLILEEEGNTGLLLPQVATEHKFDVTSFLNAICQKAGVDQRLWQKKRLNLKAFTATVFSETGKRKRTFERI